ncbi:hypothetical protein ACFYY8_06310 [Streptosporangium sp. NPDC001559]|uniref:hypothetical protein n=1 Tax=Streptosporangium sp. NPDC001559 TaxID=3366187 RepID=UPI0036EC766B
MSRHERWTDAGVIPGPATAAAPGYSSAPAGPVRRAPLYDGDTLLGQVWTDDADAAGFRPDEQAGPAGVQAGAYVWAVMAECHKRDIPAAELLDPVLYEPTYQLRL